MYQKKTNRVFLTLGISLFILGMSVAALWDLALNKTIHAPTFFPAVWMECFGYYPLYLPAFLWLACEMIAPNRAAWLRGLCAIGQLAGMGILAWNSYENLIKRNITELALPLTVGTWAALALLEVALLVTIHQKKQSLREKLCFVFRWATVYIILETVVINLLKQLWNRTRFDDMLAQGGFEQFTSWLHPLGEGGTSFPSGHTASACGIFVLVLLCDVLPAWHKRRTLVWGICWLYIAGMATSRLVIGRHFLSDTLMATFVMSVLFLIMVKSRPYRNSYAALQKNAEENPSISP